MISKQQPKRSRTKGRPLGIGFYCQEEDPISFFDQLLGLVFKVIQTNCGSRNADCGFLNPKDETWNLKLPLIINPEQSLGVTRQTSSGHARSASSGQAFGEAQYQLQKADCGMWNFEAEFYI
jgi:hypothetical protein